MCLIVLARGQFPKHPFVMSFNRDEVYYRATQAAHWWEDVPRVLGGRDLERGGVWGGIRYSGEIALLTFWRQGKSRRSERSRGELVANYLRIPTAPEKYIDLIRKDSAGYLGYNLIVGAINGDLLHYSNVTDRVTPIGDGIWGLSNADLNAPWPKVKRSTAALAELCKRGELAPKQLFGLMSDRSPGLEHELPDTGIGFAREYALSSIFIAEEDYGTRSTTVIMESSAGQIDFLERSHSSPWSDAGEVRYSWRYRYPG